MKSLSALAAAALLACAAPALAATGSGNPVTQARAVSGFDGIGLAVPGKLEIVQDGTESATVTVDDNLAADLETTVVKGKLRIRWREGVEHRAKAPIRIVVHAKALNSISIAGAGSVSAPALAAAQLKVHIAGSGDMRLGGKAEALDVHIAGSGDVNASKLDAERTRVHVAGSGDATVVARRALDAHVAGSGDVKYYGDPTVQRKVAGSGSVRRVGAAPG